MIIVFLISLSTCSMDSETAPTFTHGHFRFLQWIPCCFLFFSLFQKTARKLAFLHN